jgi:hypothetical protein
MASGRQVSYSVTDAQTGGITMLRMPDEHEARRSVFDTERTALEAAANTDFGSLLRSDEVVGGKAAEGERCLVRAVLEDALNCYQTHLFAHDVRGRRLFAEAELWIMRGAPYSPGTKPFFSFDYVCDVLGIDADYIRRGLKEWTQKQRSFQVRRRVA